MARINIASTGSESYGSEATSTLTTCTRCTAEGNIMITTGIDGKNGRAKSHAEAEQETENGACRDASDRVGKVVEDIGRNAASIPKELCGREHATRKRHERRTIESYIRPSIMKVSGRQSKAGGAGIDRQGGCSERHHGVSALLFDRETGVELLVVRREHHMVPSRSTNGTLLSRDSRTALAWSSSPERCRPEQPWSS